MDSGQIQKHRDVSHYDDSFWLKEIAYQLAVINERAAELQNAQAENRVLELQAMIATLGGTTIPVAGYGKLSVDLSGETI